MSDPEQMKAFYKAFIKAQSEMPFPSLDKKNPHFRSSYSSLAEVIKSTRDALTSNGLCFMQILVSSELNGQRLVTRIAHSEGGYIEGEVVVNPPSQKIQELGSYITYLRRYSLMSLLGIVGDEDDDGNSAQEAQQKKEYKPKKEEKEDNSSKLLEVRTYLKLVPEYENNIRQFIERNDLSCIEDVPVQSLDVMIQHMKNRLDKKRSTIQEA